jgi:hypothetical protein
MTAASTPGSATVPPGAGARDQIDALRAAADLLVQQPVEDPWIAVTGDSIQLGPGGPAASKAAAVAALAAQLAPTAEITRHRGRTWHTARGYLGRHPVTVFADPGEGEPTP